MSYLGPFKSQCILNVEKAAGFAAESWLHPNNLTDDELNRIDMWNLRYVYSAMNLLISIKIKIFEVSSYWKFIFSSKLA